MPRLGVPYADARVADPSAAMQSQDEAIRAKLAEGGVTPGR